MRKNNLMLIGFLGAAMLLTACVQTTPSGPGQESGQEQVKAANQADPSRCEPGKEWWRSSGSPKRGGFWTIGATGNHLDMTTGSAVGSISAIPQVYDSLLQLRICFTEDTMVIPSLAKSWEISPDGKTWTLKLRDDVKWHDKPPVNGRPFTSADVAWTIDNQQQGGVLKAFWEGVTHEQPDPFTVVLHLKEPKADFQGQLGFHTNVMLPREIKNEFGDFKSLAIGTGAFMLKDFKSGQSSVIERNPRYYLMGEDGSPLPYIDGIRTITIPDSAGTLAALLSGQLDRGSVGDLLQFEELKRRSPKLRAYRVIEGSINGIYINPTRKPWDDVRVRKALALTLDREEIIQGSQQGGGYAAGFFPASLPEYLWPQEKLKERFKPNREQARKLLAEAGFAPGELKVVMKTTGSYVQAAEIAQAQMQSVGIDTTIVVETPIPGGGGASIVAAKGDFDILWAALAPSDFPDYWAYDLIRTGSLQNITRLSDSQVDALGDAQRREMDPAKRKQILNQLQDRLFDLMPYVPVLSRSQYFVDSCQTKNMLLRHPNSYQQIGIVGAWLDSTGCD